MDAVALGDGDRPTTARAARATQDRESIIGRYSIDDEGHTTSTGYGRMAIVDRTLVWDNSAAPLDSAAVADWVTISSLATAGGTLVLAGATFSAVRSSNRSARLAERSLMAGLRPLLMPSRPDDPPQKVGFVDGRWLHVPGGGGAAELGEEAVYLAMSVRNVGTGIAVLHGWRFGRDPATGNQPPPPLEEFERLTRDLYVPAGDIGFWQGVFREPDREEFRRAAEAIAARERLIVDVLYGDHEGGQRVVSRFSLTPAGDGRWIAAAGRHWNIDRDDPR